MGDLEKQYKQWRDIRTFQAARRGTRTVRPAIRHAGTCRARVMGHPHGYSQVSWVPHQQQPRRVPGQGTETEHNWLEQAD
jgi:hypothetical protein